MTTKEQERDALNKIRELLGTLDADGWVNMAFRGVCDIAENNIRDDFADSPVELAEARGEELRKVNAELKKALAEAEDKQSAIDRHKEQSKRERKAYDECNAALRTERDKTYALLRELRKQFQIDLSGANSIILECCDESDSENFKKAVKIRKRAKYWLDRIEEMIS